MFVIKRCGQREPVKFDKVTARIKKLCHGLHESVNPVAVAQKVVAGVFDGVSTTQLDILAAETAASMAPQHPDYSLLAGRIVVSNLHKVVPASFAEVIDALYSYMNPRTGKPSPLISKDVHALVMANKETLDAELCHTRDMDALDYFAFKTLERSYLLRMNGQVAERPQHMWMRVAVGIHKDDLQAAIQTYHLMSQGWFTHASPTLFNAGTPRPALSSCFLLTMQEDSIEGIYNTLKRCALISKNAGGIGLAVHDIRATGSYIAGTNGTSNGLVPMLKVFNDTARYCDQCFTPETIVYTAAGPKQIQDVTISDKLLSATGRFQPVEKLLRHTYDGMILNISTEMGDCVRVTGEHQVLSLAAQAAAQLPQMTDAKDLHVGDFICFPVINDDCCSSQDIPAVQETDCFFYGMMLAAGTIADDVSSLKTERQLAASKAQAYLSNRGIQYRVEGSKFVWPTASVGFLFHKTQLQNGIDPAFMNLPRPKLKALYEGIITATAEAASPASVLFKQHLPWLLMRLGNPAGTYYQDQGIMYARINAIKEEQYKGTVYDFEVAEEHTYVTAALGAVHNGGGKRKGAFAIYLEPWHADIFDFLDLRKNHGKEELRARDLFYGLWIPDLFMQRVQAGADWSLFCPHEAPGLADVHGSAFEQLYMHYEQEGRAHRKVKAQDLWFAILAAQQETGTPFMMYKVSVFMRHWLKSIYA